MKTRFCTVILTVSGEDQHVDPVLLFKGKGHISPNEQKQYANDIKVFFTPESVINTITMNKYNEWFISKVQDGHPKMLIVDSANSHLNPETIRNLRKKSVIVAVISTGCTMYLQALDVSIFSTFKNHYTDAAEEYIEQNAWIRTKSSTNFNEEFTKIGYIWKHNIRITPRTLQNYTYDPSIINCVSLNINEDDDEEQIQNAATLAAEQDKIILNEKSKQLKLTDLWKKELK
ncbi:unnamed protein product [Adineta steineri]|uniref:DDE-1 domain-containing protein n=1 Tax=Adineta steineri TaxID=433720 RepID=A0A818UCP2_9BILA|nr:unnamed protein product [Adineta steineri]